ncbi:phage tail protein [Pleionea sp. CnH1-48]|uniref:phage tail protein n=1 Tax=Pleionea sp. CnH1-48 TaxID=2954494 RepID=UPI0020975DD8|nr:phage tail protein [Pleionea sp. CnH1-48]MCO7223330.1 phage tail protein [Pleionea sp. CnH1-48]
MDLPRLDPLPGYNFRVALIEGDSVGAALLSGLAGLALGGFSEVSGLDASIGIYEHLEGGVNDRVHKFADRASYSNITLKRGVGLSEDLYLWHQDFIKGEGAARNGLIVLANDLGIPIKVWTFFNGIPVKWTGPEFNAMTSAIAVESLEIAHEKVELTLSPGMLTSLI